MQKVVDLKQNGLNAIFSKFEAESQLYGTLKAIWDSTVSVDRPDTVLSALYVTESSGHSIHGSIHTYTEYKINYITETRYNFMGVSLPSEVELSDIVGQVYVVKAISNRDIPIISHAYPWPMIKCLGVMEHFGQMGMVESLANYSRLLFDAGFRIVYFNVSKDAFYLNMLFEDVLVKIVIHTKDYLTTLYYHAHNNPSFQ